jgi:hypothetical protein
MILQGVERAQSLAAAVVSIARERRSALLNPADLWDLVKVQCPDDHETYPSAGTVIGLLQYEGWEKISLGWWGGPIANNARKVGELRRLIEAEKVMFWDREEDQSWRIVDSNWLFSHRDIWDWLHRQWTGGHRCRYCAMVENPLLDELKRVELEHPLDMLARRLNGASTHERCKAHFVDWLAIAAKYSSEKEAEAADKAAGRVSRYQKVTQAARLEAAAR